MEADSGPPPPRASSRVALPRLTWGSAWVVAVAVCTFVWAPPLAPAVYGLGGLWLLAALLAGRAGRAMVVRQEVSATHLAPGQPVTVRITLRNGTPFPVPWIWFEEPLPVQLEAAGRFRACGAVAPHGPCSAEFTLRPARRGRYRIGSIAFRLGDWFGLCTAEGRADLPLWVTVYPPIVPLPTLHPVTRVPEGPRTDPHSPFREELTQGIRPYASGDPQRWIAWKATARHDQLLVRQFPHVRERATTVLLDLEADAWQRLASRQALERVFSVAASFFWAPPDGDQATGLFTHARSVRYVAEGTGEVSEPARFLRIPARRGLEHRRQILETLAVLRPAQGPPLEHLLLLLRRRLIPGEDVLVMTTGHRPGAWAAAAHLAAGHHPVTILAFGAGELPACPGVRVLSVAPEGEVQWGWG